MRPRIPADAPRDETLPLPSTAADQMMSLEARTGRMERVASPEHIALRAARAEMASPQLPFPPWSCFEP